MRQIRIAFVLLITGLLITGCKDRTELNELGITAATGFDGHKGDWINTYQVIIPSAMSSGAGGSSGGASKSAVHTFSTHGKTVREAVASSRENPRRLYFAHNNIILIGKKTAEEGIEEILDIYYRNLDARQTVKVFIANGEARDFLKMFVPPEKLPGQALSKIVERNSQLGSVYPQISLHELALKISSDSGIATVPEVSIAGSDPEKLDSVDVFKQTSSKSKLKLSGLSIFDKDKKVGHLNQKESLGVSWLTNQIKTTALSYVDENSNVSAFLIRKAKVKVTPIKGPLHYSLKVNAKADAEIIETTSLENMKNMQHINQFQHQAEKTIELQIREGWEAVQKRNIDLVGIGNKIHQKYPQDWKKIKETWPKELASMDMELDVKVNIKRPGLFQKSFKELLESENDN
ncbi:Ger(x)C family spore germination protein [Paenibacillus peoriae]|uniref:Ger(x)C family spore germination protein n=1 Tax=Paenibacillus peoriae TaxID=59893 RepID=UPI003F9B4CA9